MVADLSLDRLSKTSGRGDTVQGLVWSVVFLLFIKQLDKVAVVSLQPRTSNHGQEVIDKWQSQTKTTLTGK